MSSQAALSLAEEYGLPVFPCGLDKQPLTPHSFKDASKNIAQISEWWSRWPEALIGVPTGCESGLVVVDIDPAGAEWHRANADRLNCARVHKTKRGHHLVFKMPATGVRNSASKLAAGVDVRGKGGYIIWWPAQGLEATGDLLEINEPPAWLLEELHAPTNANGPFHQESSGSEDGKVGAGKRNEFLSREAYRQRKQGATVEQIIEVLRGLNFARCAPPLDEEELKQIAQGKARVLEDESRAVSFEDFYAYMPAHRYIFTPSRELWPSASVNSRLVQKKVGVDDNGDDILISASQWLDQHCAVEQCTWAPGEPMIIANRLVSDGGWIERRGCNTFNLYRPPSVALGNANDAGPWIDHVRRVYPDSADHIIAWLAHRVQHPGEKINHALVLGGAQGVGKDTILEPVKAAIGPWNFKEVSPTHLLGNFNGFVKSVILRISEARDLGDVDRYALYDHLKVYTAAPPDVLHCNEKNIKEHAVMNVMGVIITTNHKADGIYLPADDRRHYVAWSTLSKDDFDAAYFRGLYHWYANDGIESVAAYLLGLDLRSFDSKAPPPKTAAFYNIVDSNRAPEDAELADVLEQLSNPAAVTIAQIGVYASDDFREWLNDRRNRRQIPHRLESAGYVPCRNPAATDGLWKILGKRQVVYVVRTLTPRDALSAASAFATAGR